MEISGPFHIFNTHSWINHSFIILVDILIIFISIFVLAHQSSIRNTLGSPGSQFPSSLGITSAVFNCGLGLVYLGFGFCTLVEKLTREKTILPSDGWLVVLFQGLAWLLLGITSSLRKQFRGTIVLKVNSALAMLVSAFLCIPSLWEAVGKRDISVKTVLDVLVLPGVILLVFSAIQGWRCTVTMLDATEGGSYPLTQDDNLGDELENITPLSKAGYFSQLTFWWLNPLIKKGKKKHLEEKDIPGLRREDKAQTCHSLFSEILSQRLQKESPDSSSSSSILSSLFWWHWKEILIAGIFALMKVLATSACPLLIKIFIEVAGGEQAFKYEGYALTAALFLVKCIESLSERQWDFRMRLIGVQVRSMLSTTIYEKLLKLSSASKISSGEIMSYVTVDMYKIVEFYNWLHLSWTTTLQLFLAFLIVYYCVGVAAFATLIVIVFSVVGNFPVAKLQHRCQTKFMKEQDRILQAVTEAVMTMKVLKLYAWETHFLKKIEALRCQQYCWLKGVQKVKSYSIVLFWSSPVLAPIATLGACYFLRIPLKTSNVFTFLATIGLIQKPIRCIPDIFGAFIGAKVSLDRIMKLLNTPELLTQGSISNCTCKKCGYSIYLKVSGISWDRNYIRPILRNIDMMVRPGERVAICGEVGSGKTTFLAAILGEVPSINGMVQVCGKIAYVSQAAWIQTGTIQENILFGSIMDPLRYQDTLAKCSLSKDLEMLPFGDLTVIGERGVNLSGGQKQRIQLARALYKDADIYLLDDPFSAVDAHTATHLFNECVKGALSGKTVLLVTHQVDFLPEFDSILLMSEEQIIRAYSYEELLAVSEDFRSLVSANDIAASNSSSKDFFVNEDSAEIPHFGSKESNYTDQLIKQEEREVGDAGLKPYLQYLKHGHTLLYFSLSNSMYSLFLLGQFAQNCLLAANLRDSGTISKPMVIAVYAAIGCSMTIFLLARTFFLFHLSLAASRSIFSLLLRSLFRAPLSFYDSTPLGRILSRVSSDLSIVDLDISLKLSLALGSTLYVYFGFGVITVIAWGVLFVIIPTVYLVTVLQEYYYASARELMRIEGTTKSLVASHFAETANGVITIRSFGEQSQFSTRTVDLLDRHASATFHSFSANEWCVLYLEIIYAVVLSASALFMTILPHKDLASGFVAMALTYGISLGGNFTLSIQSQCDLANMMISVERIEQHMQIASEAPEIIEDRRPAPGWPYVGKVEIRELKVKYQHNAPLVLRGISCVFEGGDKIGIVGRTGCGKTTLISTLFRLVEPTEGKIIVDGIDISTIGLHDLRSHFGAIPQEPILFYGSVRFNLDPLSEHMDKEIWEVLEKCQLKEAVQEKSEGLDSLVVQGGSNWSMGQRQLFCLGRTLLKRRKVLVLDEATSSIDNATDLIIQNIIRDEFIGSTVITVAHRIPTVMDCDKVLALSDGELVEFDEPKKLMSHEDSLFGRLVREYRSRSGNAEG